MSPAVRREVKRQLAVITDAEERVVIATGRYIGEGFDDARLDTLFLALPVSWKGTLLGICGGAQMPWQECSKMDERLRFVARQPFQKEGLELINARTGSVADPSNELSR